MSEAHSVLLPSRLPVVLFRTLYSFLVAPSWAHFSLSTCLGHDTVNDAYMDVIRVWLVSQSKIGAIRAFSWIYFCSCPSLVPTVALEAYVLSAWVFLLGDYI